MKSVHHETVSFPKEFNSEKFIAYHLLENSSYPALRTRCIASLFVFSTSDKIQKGMTRALSIISPRLGKKVSVSTGT